MTGQDAGLVGTSWLALSLDVEDIKQEWTAEDASLPLNG
jgi:hypothetical protein